MRSLMEPVLVPGDLAKSEQPRLRADGNLLLRPWRLTDAPDLLAALGDPSIQYWNLCEGGSEEDARDWIEQGHRAWQAESEGHWAVVDAATDALAGKVSLRHIIPLLGCAEVTYWTLPAARGTGVSPHAVAALCAWAFEDAGFHRLELSHSAANPASCRVAEKSGFAHEGTRRSALLHADGWHDMHLHGRLNPR
jgi:RimJ/RimL family protein N-acetyltransferase